MITVLFLSVSCTNSVPEISYGFLHLVQYQGEAGPVEHFSFFIMPVDNDGIDNLDELYFYHDREQLRWRIKSDEWLSYTIDGKTWIGTRSIAAQDGRLPRGLFRAVLYNKGGEKNERNFVFDGSVHYPFPEIVIADGRYEIKSMWPNNKLVCYDSSGNFINTYKIESLTGNVSDLRLPSSASTAALWTEDEANFCSAFTDVVSIH